MLCILVVLILRISFLIFLCCLLNYLFIFRFFRLFFYYNLPLLFSTFLSTVHSSAHFETFFSHFHFAYNIVVILI